MDIIRDNNPVSETIKKLSPGVFRLIYRIVRDREEALDLTQDVFVKILGRYARVKEITKLKAYIYKTAYHLALNARRDRQRHRAGEAILLEEQMHTDTNNFNDTPERDAHRRLISAAVDKLPARQKECLNLRFYGDLTVNETARVMGITEGSVKVHLARGLQNLRTRLTTENKEEST